MCDTFYCSVKHTVKVVWTYRGISPLVQNLSVCLSLFTRHCNIRMLKNAGVSHISISLFFLWKGVIQGWNQARCKCFDETLAGTTQPRGYDGDFTGTQYQILWKGINLVCQMLYWGYNAILAWKHSVLERRVFFVFFLHQAFMRSRCASCYKK